MQEPKSNNPNIDAEIRSALKQFTPEQVKDALKTAGYPDDKIDALMLAIQEESDAPEKQVWGEKLYNRMTSTIYGRGMMGLSKILQESVKSVLPAEFEESKAPLTTSWKPKRLAWPEIFSILDMDISSGLSNMVSYLDKSGFGTDKDEGQRMWEQMQQENPMFFGMIDEFRKSSGTALASGMTTEEFNERWSQNQPNKFLISCQHSRNLRWQKT